MGNTENSPHSVKAVRYTVSLLSLERVQIRVKNRQILIQDSMGAM